MMRIGSERAEIFHEVRKISKSCAVNKERKKRSDAEIKRDADRRKYFFLSKKKYTEEKGIYLYKSR